jgi:hypothetical protein
MTVCAQRSAHAFSSNQTSDNLETDGDRVMIDRYQHNVERQVFRTIEQTVDSSARDI